MHIQNGGFPKTLKRMMMMMMVMLVMTVMIVIANLIVQKLGNIVIESRDHAVPLLVPVEVLIKVVVFFTLNLEVPVHKKYGLNNHVKYHPYIDPKSGELRFTTPLCKVNILKMNK